MQHRTQPPFETVGELIALVDGFEKGTLTADEWNHRARMAVAIVYVLMGSADEAKERLRVQIPVFNHAVGITDPAFAYHETLTTLFLRAIDAGLARCESDSLLGCANELLQGPLGDPSFPTWFYSEGRLWSDAAKDSFVQPDRRPIPAA